MNFKVCWMWHKQETPSDILLDFYTFAGCIHQPWCRQHSTADQDLFILTPCLLIGLQILQEVITDSEIAILYTSIIKSE